MLQRTPNADSLIRFDFRIATAEDMTALGREASVLFSLDYANYEFQSLVCMTGIPDSGKTHFCKGLTSVFKPVSVETLNRQPFNAVTEAGGHICHFDYKDDPDYHPRLDQTTDHSTVFVEHGELSDMDFTHWIEVKEAENGHRHVSIEIPEDMAEERSTELFRQRTQKFAHNFTLV